MGTLNLSIFAKHFTDLSQNIHITELLKSVDTNSKIDGIRAVSRVFKNPCRTKLNIFATCT